MKMLKFVTLLGAVAAVACCSWLTPARANDDKNPGEEFITLEEVNPIIDCKPRPPDRNFTAMYTHAGIGTNSNCQACHRGSFPVAGRGDKPATTAAAFAVQNKLTTPVQYEVKVGSKGQWQQKELKPGGVENFSFAYKAAGQNKAPEYWVRYASDPEKRERKLTPVATPNKNLGNFYFFNQDPGDKQVYLYQPGTNITRAARR